MGLLLENWVLLDQLSKSIEDGIGLDLSPISMRNMELLTRLIRVLQSAC